MREKKDLTCISDWISVEEVARRTERSRTLVRTWMEEGRVRFIEKGKRQYLIYWPSVVDAGLESIAKPNYHAINKKGD